MQQLLAMLFFSVALSLSGPWTKEPQTLGEGEKTKFTPFLPFSCSRSSSYYCICGFGSGLRGSISSRIAA